METLIATSLCIGVLGALFLPNEYKRMTAAEVPRTLNCWPLPDKQAVARFVETRTRQVDSGPLERSVQWHEGIYQRQLPLPIKLSKDANCLALDPLAERMFVGFNNGILQRFLLGDAEPEVTVLGCAPGLTDVVCAPNGQTLLTASIRGLEAWDLRPPLGVSWKTPRLLTAEKIDCLAFSPCSSIVAVGIASGPVSQLVEIDLGCGATVPLMKLSERLDRLLMSADGKQMAAIHESGKILLFQRASYRSSWQLVDFPGLRTHAVLLASYSPDSSLLVTCERYRTLLVWDLRTKTVRQRADSPTENLQGCAFLDSSHVLTWGLNRILKDGFYFLEDDVAVIKL